MTSGTPRLGQVEPRERVGAQTGRKYEFQYERTARATLELLADGTTQVCVYCDWHDDYVSEVGNPPTRYVFHQIKGRKSSQGPWKFKEFFGVLRKQTAKATKKPAPVTTRSIIPRMILHHTNFGDGCAGLVFITNAGLDPELTNFLTDIRDSVTADNLPEKTKNAFKHLARAYLATNPALAGSSSELFSWLRGIEVHTDKGNLEDQNAALLELADVVADYSEIELFQQQAKQIAREVVSHVRGKVSHSTTVVPSSDDQLRRDKGVVIADLLKVLSLSAQAYEQLKAGAGPETVKNLSRLDRYCRKHGLSNYLVQICGFKAQWDIWRTIERHFINSADYLLLEARATELLASGLTVDSKLVLEAKDIAKQFGGLTATPLTAEHVLGLLFSVAAQAEALSHS